MPIWGLPAGLGDIPRDLICPRDDEAERELLPAVIDELRRTTRGWFVLERVLENSAAWRCLGHVWSRSYCTDVMGATDFIDCDRPFDVLYGTLSRNLRGNLRNARNRLATVAGVRFERARAGADLQRVFEGFLRAEAAGWKGAEGTRTAVALRPPQLAFYRQLAETLRAPDYCEVTALYAQDICIGAQFCVRTEMEYTVLKTGFDEAYARYSPGQLVQEEVLRQCCADDGITQVSMVGDARWIDVWKPRVVPTRSAYIALGRWTAPLLVGLQRFRIEQGPRIKRLIAPLRARLRPTGAEA